MRTSVVAALAAGGVAIGVVTASISAGSSPARDPLAPIVVEAPQSAAPETDSIAPEPTAEPAPHDIHLDGVPAPPPALRPDEQAGHKIVAPAPSPGWDGDWADDHGDATWDDTWDDSWDDTFDDGDDD